MVPEILVVVIGAVVASLLAFGPIVYSATTATNFPLSPKQFIAYDTGSGALDVDITPNESCTLYAVGVHLDGAANTGTLTVSLDSGLGASYDVVYNTSAMAGKTDYFWQPTQLILLHPSDKVNVDWANGSAATWGLTSTWNKLPERY